MKMLINGSKKNSVKIGKWKIDEKEENLLRSDRIHQSN